MKWFRMYHDARTDAKLESLTSDEFRVWFRLICFANEQPKRGVIHAISSRVLAVEVAKGNTELLQTAIEKLQDLSILRSEDSVIEFINWDKRQFESDNSTVRVQRYRNANETLQKRSSNDGETTMKHHVTAPDTDTDPDKESNKRSRVLDEYSSEFEEFWTIYPRKVEKKRAYRQWSSRIKQGVDVSTILTAVQNYATYCRNNNTEQRYIKHPATFLGPNTPYEEFVQVMQEISVTSESDRPGPYIPDGLPPEVKEILEKGGGYM